MHQKHRKLLILDSLYEYKDQDGVCDCLKKWFQVRNDKLDGNRDPRWTATDWEMVDCHTNSQEDDHSCGVFVCFVSFKLLKTLRSVFFKDKISVKLFIFTKVFKKSIC